MNFEDEEDDIPSLIELEEDQVTTSLPPLPPPLPPLIAASLLEKIVPVTILSGFLGSGKTTLLKYILTVNHGKRIAVIENEFSQGLGIENMIATNGVNGETITNNFFELNNGCICCTVKDDLLRTFEQLLTHKDKFDYILIETTGMANPGPIITSFWTDAAMDSALRLDGVVCVVDGENILTYLTSPEISFEVKQQICYADRILINKIDRISSEKQVEEVKEMIQTMNSLALIQKTTFGHVDLDFILDIHSYDSMIEEGEGEGKGASGTISSFLHCLPCLPTSTSSSSSSSSSNHLIERSSLLPGSVTSDHMEKTTMGSIAFRPEGRFHLMKLRQLLDFLLYANGESQPVITSSLMESFPVLASTSTSSSTSSYVVERLGKMKIYRMKGLFHVEGEDGLYLLQAIHNLFEMEALLSSSSSSSSSSSVSHSEEEDDVISKKRRGSSLSKEENAFIIIGLALDATLLEGLFRCCLVH